MEHCLGGYSKVSNDNRKDFFSKLRKVTSVRNMTANDLIANVCHVRAEADAIINCSKPPTSLM